MTITTKSIEERIAEIEEISLKQQNWDYDGSNFDDAMKAGAENAEIWMAQMALEIIRELEAEHKATLKRYFDLLGSDDHFRAIQKVRDKIWLELNN